MAAVRERVLALFAKAPVPGRVKTRLCPPLRPVEAAALYEAMLLDILDQHREAREDLALWYTPEGSLGWFRSHVPPVFRLLPQKGGDLGGRMAALFRTHHAEGKGRIVLRGTDSPTLPPERVAQSFELLERADLVISPDRDGGYNLIGLRAPCDPLFDRPLGGANVLEETVKKAEEEGLTLELLPEHYDVDTAEDLDRLARDVSERRTPRTLHWLRSRE